MAKGTFGERLKRERELREVPLDEIAGATRIAPKFLEALENEQWEKLPGGVFGRGFVRSIARYLGLSEENLLAEYDLARGETASPETRKPEERIPSPPKWIPAVAVLVILAVLAALVFGGVYAWRAIKARRDARKKVATAGAVSPALLAADSNAAKLAVASDPPLQLSVASSTAARLRVVADGTLAFDRQISGGDKLQFSSKKRFDVSAGDSSAVLLELNGAAVPPLGLPGSSGTISLTAKDLRPTSSGATQR
jgi:hypothetical protein